MASAMHHRFVEGTGREPDAEEIAHMKQLVVAIWNGMTCFDEGSDPFALVAPQQADSKQEHA